MLKRRIRTKIISGYVLFVALVLSFLGLNHWLVSSTGSKVEEVYEESEEIRLEMEAKNVLWAQVAAMTKYFLSGEDKYSAEFRAGRERFAGLERAAHTMKGALGYFSS